MSNSNRVQSVHTKDMVLTGMFVALILLMSFVPYLGYIPLGVTRATIIHIPVIIGALALGPRKGALLGLVFGVTSLVNNTINPTITSFCFTPFYSIGDIGGNAWSLVICFVPRILIALSAYYTYRGIRKLGKNKDRQMFALGMSGLAGSLTNTILVMGMIYVFFGSAYGAAKGIADSAVLGAILSVIVVNGIPEAIVAAVICALLGKALIRADLIKIK